MSSNYARRTTVASQFGTWSVDGPTECTNLNDETATTYVQATSDPATTYIALDQNIYPDGVQIRRVKVNVMASGGVFRAYIQFPGVKNAQYLGAIKAAATETTYGWSKPTDAHGRAWTAAAVNALQVVLVAHVNVKFYRLQVDVEYNQQPVVSSVAAAGSGTAPTISWAYTDPDGDTQERYQVKAFLDYTVAAKGFNPDKSVSFYDSGVVASSGPQHTVRKALRPGNYYFYVKATDVGSKGRYSAWAASAVYSVAGTPPAPPTLVSAVTDVANGRNIITAQQSDNLLSYQQAGFELAGVAPGWYKDTNVTTLALSSTSASTNHEGANVLAMTVTAASIAKIRSGGPWTTAGIASYTTIQPKDNRRDGVLWKYTPDQVVDATATTSTVLKTKSFVTVSGDFLVAFVAFDTITPGDPAVAATVTSSPAATWTKRVEAKKSVDGCSDYVAIFTATAPVSSACTVSLTGGNTGCARLLKVVNMDGVNTAAPVGASGHGDGVAFSTSYTSTVNGSVGVAAVVDYAAGTMSPGSGMGAWSFYKSSQVAVLVETRLSSTPTSGTSVPISATGMAGSVGWCYVELKPTAIPPPGVPSNLLAAIPVQSSTVYTSAAGAWVASTANAIKNFRQDVEWYDSNGTIISTSAGTSTSTTAGNLMNFVADTVTSPVGAASAVLVLVAISPAAGEIYHFDKQGLLLGARANWSRGGMQCLNLLGLVDGSQDGGTVGSWVKVPGAGFATTTLTAVADNGIMSGTALELYGSNSSYVPVAQSPVARGADVGVIYTFYTMARPISGLTNGYVAIQFLDDVGTVLTQTQSTGFSLSSSTWAVLSVTATAPDGATAARGVISSDYVAVGAAVKWTRHGISPTSSVPVAWQPGPSPATFPLVESSDDEGDTWVTVRGCDQLNYDPTNAWQATVYDYEAPSNTERLYRVSTEGLDYGIDPFGFQTISAPSDTAALTLPVTDFYLVDPYVPSRFLMEQEGEIEFVSTEPQVLYAPLGRSTEVITYDVRKSKHFKVTLGMLLGAEFDAFEALRLSGHVLFLQTPYPRSWYVKIGPSQTTKWLISPDVTGRFNVDIELVEVARPD